MARIKISFRRKGLFSRKRPNEIKSVVVSDPNDIIYVERIELSEAMQRGLTASVNRIDSRRDVKHKNTS